MERLHICQPGLAELQPFQRAFLEAAVSAGISHRDDLLDPDGGTGVAISPVNAAGRFRWNSAFAYLDPVRDRPNLTVCGGALVERIEVTGRPGRGIAVTAIIHSRRSRIVTGKVVLCAGAYGTAEVLLRSGIGPARDLRRLGIPVAADLPGVGANLHDHPTAVRSFAAATPLRSGVEAELAHPCHVVLDRERACQLPAAHPEDVDLIDILEAPAGRRMTHPFPRWMPEQGKCAATLRLSVMSLWMSRTQRVRRPFVPPGAPPRPRRTPARPSTA